MLGTLGTVLTVMSGFNTVMDAYKNAGVLVNGDGTDRILDAIRETQKELVQLKENIYFAAQWRAVSDTAQPSRAISDLRTVCQVLEPVQQAIGGKIVSSRLIETPGKMEVALKANPWSVLHDIRPQHLVVRPTNPDMVPVMFSHGGITYIGWQLRGTLPMLFNCELHDLSGVHRRTPGTMRPKGDDIKGRIEWGRPGDDRAEYRARASQEATKPLAIPDNLQVEPASKNTPENDPAVQVLKGFSSDFAEFLRRDGRYNGTLWYVARYRHPYGPLSEGQLVDFINRGYLEALDLLWCYGFSSWRKAIDVVSIVLREKPSNSVAAKGYDALIDHMLVNRDEALTPQKIAAWQNEVRALLTAKERLIFDRPSHIPRGSPAERDEGLTRLIWILWGRHHGTRVVLRQLRKVASESAQG